MIKVKISKVRKFAVSSEPTSFDITLKTSEYIQKGILVIDFTKKTISTDLKIPLSDESQLAVLKAIFYSFCITEAKRVKNKTSQHIEEFEFIDVPKRKIGKTIIEYLLEYDLKDFDEYRRKEKIIAQIKKSYDSICKGVKNKQIEIKLDPICNFSSKEEKVYKNILQKYLKRKKFNGVLQDVSREYNESFKGMYPYFYNLNLFYALKYVNIER